MKTKVNFIPTHGAVLVELPEVKEETQSGIIKSPDMVEEEKTNHDGFLEVVSACPDAIVKAGAKIMANLPQCSIIDIDEEKYGLVPKHAIIGYKPE
jgi:co-chaperonin GroES (HSP10)